MADGMPTSLKIYWYIDRRGSRKMGSSSKAKRDHMAERAHSAQLGECDISEFDGHLLGEEWRG